MSEWIETTSGNRISKKAEITGSQNILLSGNTTICSKVCLNGDVQLLDSKQSTIQIGKYCYIDENVKIEPPVINASKRMYGPLKIGSYTIIKSNCSIQSANIGNRVIIESDVTLHNLSIVYDCCIIRQGTVIPSKMIIPPFSDVSGVGESLCIKELNNSYKKIIENEARELMILG